MTTDNMEYLQAQLCKLQYVDYGDPYRCIKLQCHNKPTTVSAFCGCRGLCSACLTEYQNIESLGSYCPICLLKGVTFEHDAGYVPPPPPTPQVVPPPPQTNGKHCPQCQSIAVKRISKSPANPNRAFWACPNWCKGVWLGWIN